MISTPSCCGNSASAAGSKVKPSDAVSPGPTVTGAPVVRMQGQLVATCSRVNGPLRRFLRISVARAGSGPRSLLRSIGSGLISNGKRPCSALAKFRGRGGYHSAAGSVSATAVETTPAVVASIAKEIKRP